MNNPKIEIGRRLHPLIILLVLVVGGCADSNEPPPPNPIIVPDEPDTTTISGVAAVGAALDGATVEVIDANGNLVEIPDTLTGNDGSYQVTLPEDTVLPVIIRVTPPSGEPLLNIVPEPEEGTTEIVANINPITNLVAETVLGDVDETDASDLGAALTTADTTTVDEVGDEVVGKILGSNVDYDTFSSDENFTANDGENSGSAADAILDTIAKNAEEGGVTLEEQLSMLAEEENPPKLLEDPSFQIKLVSEIVQGGTDSANIEGELAEIGALPEAVEGEPDVFRTIIEVVPAVIQETVAGSEELGDNENLKDIAVEAAVDLLIDVVEQKKDRFEANDEELADLLSSDSLKDTVVGVVTEVVVPILETFNDEPEVENVQNALETVVDTVVEEAGDVASSFEYTENSADVSDLVTGYVKEEVAPQEAVTLETLESIEDGTTDVTELVTEVEDVSQVQNDIQEFAEENPDLVVEPIDDLIEEIPAGTWGDSAWGDFNWG